ncbi:hypothetical protein [Maricaulis sp.]|uniref:hypothetical protein n=1 Tax=Maricaulis sp. TaxID=1486257 RepID=UPI002B265B4E|nr:hypothetical protein [Maricaulis sp.]
MSVFILAALLVLQDAEIQPGPEATATQEAAPQAGEPQAGADTDEPMADSPPTDAASLIARIEGRFASHADTVAEMAGRKARERYLSELLLPVISRADLDDGAQGEILAALSGQIHEIEANNSQWALDQIDPDSFLTVWTDNPRLGAELLRMAQRAPDSQARLVAALEPVALAGAYDGAAYAAMADALAVSQNQPQPYGTATECVDGLTQVWPLADPDTIDAARTALGLARFDANAIAGQACETTEAEQP